MSLLGDIGFPARTCPILNLHEERMAKAAARVARSAVIDEGAAAPVDVGELSDLLGYALKRAQLRLYEDFLKCVAPLQLTPAQFSVLMLLEKNPGRNQTEVAGALGILRPNFVAMLAARTYCR
jgi:hypothetical protein